MQFTKKSADKKKRKHAFFVDINSAVSSSFSKSDSSMSTESPNKESTIQKYKSSKEHSPKTTTNDSGFMNSPRKSSRESKTVKTTSKELQFVPWSKIYRIPLSLTKTFSSLKIPTVGCFEELQLKKFIAAYVVVEEEHLETVHFKTIYYVNQEQAKELANWIHRCPSYSPSLSWCGMLSTQKIPTIEELDTLLPNQFVAAYIQVEHNDVKAIYYANKEVPECYLLENLSQSVYQEFETIPYNKSITLSVKMLNLLNHSPTRYSLTAKSLGELDESFYRATYANLPLYEQARAVLKKLEAEDNPDEFRITSYKNTLVIAPAEENRLNALKEILLSFINTAYKEFQVTYRVSEEDHILISEGLIARLMNIFKTDINIACKTFFGEMIDVDLGLSSIKNPFKLDKLMNPDQLQAWLVFQTTHFTSYLCNYNFNVPNQLTACIKNYILNTDMKLYEKFTEIIQKNSIAVLEKQYNLSPFLIEISPPEENSNSMYLGK